MQGSYTSVRGISSSWALQRVCTAAFEPIAFDAQCTGEVVCSTLAITTGPRWFAWSCQSAQEQIREYLSNPSEPPSSTIKHAILRHLAGINTVVEVTLFLHALPLCEVTAVYGNSARNCTQLGPSVASLGSTLRWIKPRFSCF